MPVFRSILSRIVSMHVIAIAITSAFMPLALYLLLRSEATELQRQAMNNNANIIAQYLEPRPDGGFGLNLPSSLQKVFSDAYGRYGYAILDNAGNLLYSSHHDPKIALVPNVLRDQPEFFKFRRGKAVIFGANIPKTIRGRTVWIHITQDLAHRDVLVDDIVSGFFRRVGWITVPILLFLLAIDLAIFKRALRPLVQASEMAKAIGPARTDVRLPVKRMPSEIVPLVRTVNEALDRLERGFQLQRAFTADAAHELRTPLAILRVRIATLADKNAATALDGDIAAMTRIVGQMLDSAELEHFALAPGDIADLKGVGLKVAAFMAPLALAEGKQVALNAPSEGVLINGNEEAMFRAVRNLTENALRYTPRDTTVEITVTQDGTLSVLDLGPGIDESDRELIFQRFWRKDRRQSGNAGLGLSIVKRIVEAHHGSITVGNRATGGAIFSLQFATLTRSTDEVPPISASYL
jgi:signal transduction histidine kinase